VLAERGNAVNAKPLNGRTEPANRALPQPHTASLPVKNRLFAAAMTSAPRGSQTEKCQDDQKTGTPGWIWKANLSFRPPSPHR